MGYLYWCAQKDDTGGRRDGSQPMLGDEAALEVAVAGGLLDITVLRCRSSSAMFHAGGWVCSSLCLGNGRTEAESCSNG